MEKHYTLQEIAEYTSSHLIGNPHQTICWFAELETASESDISFFAKPKYDHVRHEKAFKETKAGAIFVDPTTALFPDRNYLVNSNPSLAFQNMIERMSPPIKSAFTAIHPTAVIHSTCQIEDNVAIGPYVVIDHSVIIGNGTKIYAGCSIGPQTQIGEQCAIHANVVIREGTSIGNRVTIQPGAVIGSCGFGYQTDAMGKHIHLKHLGRVIIEDDVDIGANTTIDRARFKETRIKQGTKIDNLVQIGHGAKVGEDNLIVAQTGIAGSSETGKHVVLGGQVGVNGHIKIGSRVVVTARSGVSKSLTEAGKYGGMPVAPLNEHNRNSVYLRNIEKYIKRIEELENKLQKLGPGQ